MSMAGRWPYIHNQIVTEDGNSVEEEEQVDDCEGGHTILHIAPTAYKEEEDVHDNSLGRTEEYEITDQSASDLNIMRNNKSFYCPNCGNCYSAEKESKCNTLDITDSNCSVLSFLRENTEKKICFPTGQYQNSWQQT